MTRGDVRQIRMVLSKPNLHTALIHVTPHASSTRDFISKAQEEPLDDTPGRQRLSRPILLSQAGTVGGLTAAQAILSPLRAEDPLVLSDPTTVPGTPPSRYGGLSPFEKSERVARSC